MEKEKINDARLAELFNEVIREAISIGIPIGMDIRGPVVNKRAKTRFGCCKAEKIFPGTVQYTIEISERILTAPEKNIKEIIAHELLHTCRGCMNHGKKWKTYAEKFGNAFGYKITRTSTDTSFGLSVTKAEAAPPRYMLVSSRCGREYLRRRRSRVVEHPEQYRCGKCGGHLKLSQKPLHLVDEKYL